MLKITELKPGVLIELDGTPCQIITASHKMLGRGHAMTKAKLKNLKTGAQIERVFKGNDVLQEVNLSKIKAIFLWHDKANFHFMDLQTSSQFSLPSAPIGFAKNFLIEGSEVEILMFSDKPLSVNLPIKMGFKVVETEPGIRGGRETPGTKKAVLETGFAIQAPLFIKEGDTVIVDTRDGKYVERAK